MKNEEGASGRNSSAPSPRSTGENSPAHAVYYTDTAGNDHQKLC